MQDEFNQLMALYNAGHYAELESRAHLLLEQHPDSGLAWKILGATLQVQGKDSLHALRKATEFSPNDAEAHNNLGAAFKDIGRMDEAEASLRRALEIKPEIAEVHSNLGQILLAQCRFDEAEVSYRRALKIKPGYAEAYGGLGGALLYMGCLNEAEVNCRRALDIQPGLAEAYCNLGEILRLQGRLGEAEASFRRALEIKPDFVDAWSTLLFSCGYHALLDPREYLAQARNWELDCVSAQDRQAAHNRTFNRIPLAGMRLRVGYVSGDYRQHAVSYFIEQLFAHHDRARIELFAYSNHVQSDTVTERLRALVEHWVPIAGIPDAAIRERIEADGIDVLIDLSGHTGHSRLGIFARRAAPVQAHYLGYFASTGLTEMDYWIGDEILTPPETDSHFSERVWRLPRVWVSYDGKAGVPVPDWQPSQDGVVWLGSFNNLSKLTPATLNLWAKVLHALPEGKLLLKTKELSDNVTRQRILDAMSGYGIGSDRIELQGSSATPGWMEHMAYYNRLDIALDPVGGVGGGTTTCDALWMGVPVIACEGDRMASLMTASMLNAVGRSEWVARSEAEYMGKVIALARDVEQRKALRFVQRNRMASSPLCDARGLAMSLENAYFEMFERWFDEKN
ncbi:MAG: tetratricopeptide repeat protein [Gallionella sp.]|nr:tetratricopeptide repeat protein [Gallionella sp.]